MPRSTQHVDCEWIISAPHPRRDEFASTARIPPLVAQLLLNRGIEHPEQVGTFLSPAFRLLECPDRLPGAMAAAERLLAAARDGRKIVIYGDYDVDGVTATSILWHTLRSLGAAVDYYIPSRLDEGYGVNADALRQIAGDGGEVVITVDCGITAVAEAAVAREIGLELIISDHHQPADTLPDAVIVHPTALGESPNPHLSGAGVALKVAWALAQQASRASRVSDAFRDVLVEATALAALGLIADVVPLVGENRIIAAFGLKQLCQTHNPGLKALIDVSGLNGKRRLDDYDVGFALAPRLNAIGRLGHAREAVELLTEADAERAAEIARRLEGLNRERQSVERGILREAEALVEQNGFHRDSCRGIVLARPEWHPGVIGIVASRLVERFCRPTILIALDNDEGQGSGRSVRHFPLYEAIAACSDHLVRFGGHAMAAGVKIKARAVDGFTDAFLAEAAQRLTARDLLPRLYLDDEVQLGDLTSGAVEPLLRMAPFGMGNARPLLATSECELADAPRVIGSRGTHLSFTVRQGQAFRRAVWFNAAARIEQLGDYRRLKLAFEPTINEWNGQRKVELKVRDWKLLG